MPCPHPAPACRVAPHPHRRWTRRRSRAPWSTGVTAPPMCLPCVGTGSGPRYLSQPVQLDCPVSAQTGAACPIPDRERSLRTPRSIHSDGPCTRILVACTPLLPRQCAGRIYPSLGLLPGGQPLQSHGSASTRCGPAMRGVGGRTTVRGARSAGAPPMRGGVRSAVEAGRTTSTSIVNRDSCMPACLQPAAL